MASTLENALRLVKPGEMVVSITDILNKLGNKLTDDEKQQLLIAMLSPRREKVQPGDLITSDMLNQLLADVADLQIRVWKLEQGSPSGSLAPVILSFVQPQPFYPGQQVTVLGKNFSTPAEANPIIIDGKAVQQYGVGSDRQLTFTVPTTLQVDFTERTVLLSITNANGLADTEWVGIKKQAIVPTGGVKLVYQGSQTSPISTKIEKNQAYVLDFEVEPSTHPDELDYLISIDSAWTAAIYDSATQSYKNQLNAKLVSGQKTLLRIKVTVPDVGTGTVNDMALSVAPTSTGTKVTRGSQALKLVVGQPLPGANDMVSISIKLLPQETTMKEGRLLFAKPTSPTQPQRRTLIFLIDFSEDAESGDYLLKCEADPHWTTTATASPLTLKNPGTGTATTIESPSCVIQADDGNAPDTTLKFTLSKGSSFNATHNLLVGISK